MPTAPPALNHIPDFGLNICNNESPRNYLTTSPTLPVAKNIIFRHFHVSNLGFDLCFPLPMNWKWRFVGAYLVSVDLFRRQRLDRRVGGVSASHLHIKATARGQSRNVAGLLTAIRACLVRLSR